MSMRFARLPSVMLLLAMLPVARAADWVYVVRPGDNPWTITERYLDGVRYWPALLEYNDIRDPTHIAPGTRLRVPRAWLRRERQPVQVTAVNGEVSVERRHEPRQALQADTVLGVGDVLVTAPDGSVELRFADGSRLYLRGGSELRIQRSERIPHTRIMRNRVQLPHGRSESRVPGASGGRFEIDTPAAVTTVRGTHFRVKADAAQASTEVIEGSVRVANEAARVALGPQTGTVALKGRAPMRARALLASPDLSGVPTELDRVPFVFSLPPLAGATRYRLQMADGAEFSTLLADTVFESPLLRSPALADGRYYLRVRGIDAGQLEGLDAVRSVVVNARPEPPFLSEPAPAQQLADGAAVFRWTRSTVAGTTYRFQLSADEAFQQLHTDVAPIDGNEVRLSPPLPPGDYAWRAAAIDPVEGQGPFSDTQTFRVLAPGPALPPPSVSEDEIEFRWRTAGSGVSYEFQLARDEGFEDLVLAQALPGAEIKLPRPAAGVYYVRARTVYPDGTVSAYATPQRIDVADRPNYWPLLIVPVIILLVL